MTNAAVKARSMGTSPRRPDRLGVRAEQGASERELGSPCQQHAQVARPAPCIRSAVTPRVFEYRAASSGSGGRCSASKRRERHLPVRVRKARESVDLVPEAVVGKEASEFLDVHLGESCPGDRRTR